MMVSEIYCTISETYTSFQKNQKQFILREFLRMNENLIQTKIVEILKWHFFIITHYYYCYWILIVNIIINWWLLNQKIIESNLYIFAYIPTVVNIIHQFIKSSSFCYCYTFSSDFAPLPFHFTIFIPKIKLNKNNETQDE